MQAGRGLTAGFGVDTSGVMGSCGACRAGSWVREAGCDVKAGSPSLRGPFLRNVEAKGGREMQVLPESSTGPGGVLAEGERAGRREPWGPAEGVSGQDAFLGLAGGRGGHGKGLRLREAGGERWDEGPLPH